MPNNPFGNPFAIPHTQVTSLKTNLPDPAQSLAALMRVQMAAERMELARARAAGGGRGRSPKDLEGNPRYGRYALVPQKDGTKKPVWVWGTSQKERDAAEAKVVGEATRAIIDGDAALQKDIANFDQLSLPGKKEALDKVRQNHAPRLAGILGISGEEMSRQLTSGLEQGIRDREKEINKAGLGTQLLHAGKQVFRNIADAIGAIGETPQQQLARGKANAEAAAQDAKENAFADEINRLNAEGRSSFGFQLSNPFRSATLQAAPLAAMIAPAIAGSAVGTIVGGPVGGVAGGMLGGAIGAGLPSGGEALSRVATDPNLPEAKKAETIGQTALASGLTAGAIGAIPIGPANLIRPALVRSAMTKQVAKTGTPEFIASKMLPEATAAQTQAATDAWIRNQAGTALRRGPYESNWYQSIGEHALNAGALGGAFHLGGNVAYNLGTGQSLPVTEGLGEAVLAGAALGLPFGVGGRLSAWKRGRVPGVDPNVTLDMTKQPGTIYDMSMQPRVERLPDAPESGPWENPYLFESGARYDVPVRTPSGGPWEDPAVALRGARDRFDSIVQAPPTGSWEDPYIATRHIYAPPAPEVRPDPLAWTREVYDANQRKQTRGDNVVSSRSPRQRGIAPLFDRVPERLADPMGVLRARKKAPLAPSAATEPTREELFERGIEEFNSREPARQAARDYITTKPPMGEIVTYLKDRLADGSLVIRDLESLRSEYEKPNRKKGQQPVRVKAIDEVLASVNREPETIGGGGGETSRVEPVGRGRAGRIDTANPVIDRPMPADTETAPATLADAIAPETPASGGTVEERGTVGTPAPDTGQVETAPATPVEPGITGAENPVGERSVEPTAALDATGSEGQREPQSAPEQRSGTAGDAEPANGERLIQALTDRYVRRGLTPEGARRQAEAVARGQVPAERGGEVIAVGPTEEVALPGATPEQRYAVARENNAKTPVELRIDAADSDEAVLEKLAGQFENSGIHKDRQGAEDAARLEFLRARNLGATAGRTAAQELHDVIYSFNAPLETQVKDAWGRVVRSYEQEAWHGTPYPGEIDRLSTDHLGSGEGAQIHGWGLYVTLSEAIARDRYQHRLAQDPRPSLKGHPLENFPTFTSIDDIEAFFGEKLPSRLQMFIDPIKEANDTIYVIKNFDLDHAKRWSWANDAKDEISFWKWVDLFYAAIEKHFPELKQWEKNNPRWRGQRFRVEIPEDNVMLREDAKFTAQPKEVQKMLRAAFEELRLVLERGKQKARGSEKLHFDILLNFIDNPEEFSGKEIYHLISQVFDPDIHIGSKDASLLLDKHGIKGIRYEGGLDGECAVLFNGDYIKILEKFYDQNGGRGRINFYNDGLARILFGNSADASTSIHEGSHWFWKRLSNYLRDGKVAPELRDQIERDLKRLGEWAGDKSGSYDIDAWSLEAIEKVARGSEAYFRTGKAPVPELEGLFARMKELLISLYRTFKELIGGNRLPKDIREIFDKELVGYKAEESPPPKTRAESPAPADLPSMIRADFRRAGLSENAADSFIEAKNWGQLRELMDQAGVAMSPETRDLLESKIRPSLPLEEEAARESRLWLNSLKGSVKLPLLNKEKLRAIGQGDLTKRREYDKKLGAQMWALTPEETRAEVIDVLRQLQGSFVWRDRANWGTVDRYNYAPFPAEQHAEELLGIIAREFNGNSRPLLFSPVESVERLEKLGVPFPTNSKEHKADRRQQIKAIEHTAPDGAAEKIREAGAVKPLTEKTYAQSVKNMTPLLRDKLKEAGLSEETVDGIIKQRRWHDARKALSKADLLDEKIETKLKRFIDYEYTRPYEDLTAGINAIENSVGAALRDLTPETLERLDETIRKTEESIQKETGEKAAQARQKIDDAKTVIDEHRKPENEPPSEDYLAMKDEKLLDASYGAQIAEAEKFLKANNRIEDMVIVGDLSTAEMNSTTSPFAINAKEFGALVKFAIDNIDKINPGKSDATARVKQVTDAFIKAGVGQSLTAKEKKLYKAALADGAEPLVINKAVIDDAVARDREQGYDTTPVEQVKTDSAESQSKMLENGKRCV